MKFKLNGYVWGNENKIPPVTAMVLGSYNNTQAGQPGGPAPHYSPNDNTTIDQISLFYGGRIYGKLGAFVQGTYDGVGRTSSWDNLDIRYADSGALGGQNLTWGLSLNNSPTVQDLWNSTPAWAFPYASSPLAPTPTAAPLIEGALAQQVLGLTAYTMIADTVYVEAGAYRTLSLHWQNNLGVDTEGETTIHGAAPYWRLALQHEFGPNYASLGLFGLSARLSPGNDSSFGTDRVTDLGYDATYQFSNGGPNSFNANLTLVHELQSLDASYRQGAVATPSNHLNTLRFNAGWVYRQTYSLSGGPFAIHGGSDPALYASDPIGGSASGSPDSRGYIAQAEWIPLGKAGSWAAPYFNARLGLQYTYYTQFNGGAANYDGNGRSAHDNNTTYLFLWLAF
jgi:hypothetical protein